MNSYEPCRVCEALTKVPDEKIGVISPTGQKYKTKYLYCSDRCSSFGSRYNNYDQEALRRKYRETTLLNKIYDSFILGTAL